MTAVQAVYDGQVFVPIKPCNITKGSKVILTIESMNTSFSEEKGRLNTDIQERIAAAERLVGIASSNPLTLEEIRNERLTRQ